MPTVSSYNNARDSNGRARALAMYMAGMAAVYATKPECREAAQQVLRGVDSRDVPAVARAIDRWMRANVAYHDNPLTGQSQPSPAYVWQERSAPCTGAAFTASIALSAGHKARLVLWGGDNAHFSHVFTEIWDPKRRAWAVVDWVPKGDFDRRRLLRGLRQEFEVDSGKVQDPKRVFVSCVQGERLPAIGAIGIAIDDFMSDAQAAMGDALNKVKASAGDAWESAKSATAQAVVDTAEQAAKKAVKQTDASLLGWATVAAMVIAAIISVSRGSR